MIEFPPYRLDLLAARLWRGHHPVALRPKAWALLCYLAERPGVLVTKGELHAALWGDAVVSDDTLTHTLAEIRQALRDDAKVPRVIETVHRRGFRFIAKPAAAPVMPDPVLEPEEDVALVGRDAEIARLLALFQLTAAGQRQVVFVHGEAGIGKSALVEAFLHEVEALPGDVLVGYGQCVEQYGEREPYMAVLEALERLGRGAARDRLVSVMRAAAPSWLAQMPYLQTPADAERLRRGQGFTTSQRMLREFSSLLEAISSDHPVVLVLEDLHWSDQGTVDLVSVLAQRPERLRMMLVGTLRPAQAAALDHPIQQVLTALRGRRRCSDIALEYLRRNDVAAYLARRLPGSPVADEVIAVVHAQTDGNPLFMTMLVDHLLARGWLTQDMDAWRLTVPRATIEQEVPDNLRQMIEGQLKRASPAEQEMLEAASVAGVAFDVPAVAAGIGGAPDAVETLCDGLSRAQRWLRHLPSSTWPDGTFAARYAFRHALYQLALYGSLSPSRRATLHQRVGERLEVGYAGRPGEVSGELARHFQASRDPQRALLYLERAALRGRDRHAYKSVVACLEPAFPLLENLPETPERARDELRLRRLYSAALSHTAGYAAGALLENLTRARSLCEKLGDSAALFDVLSELCLLHANRGDLARAEELGGQLPPLAKGLDASAALEGCFLQGGVALWRGGLGVAAPLLARALSSPVTLEEASRPYGVNPVVAARSFEGLRRWLVDDSAGGHAVQQEGLALAERHGHPFTVAQSTTFGALLLLLDERWAEAVRLATRAVDISTEYGFPRWCGTALAARGRALVEEGQGARGIAEIRTGLDELRRTGQRLGNSLLLSLLAGAYLRMDQLDEGLAAVAAGLAHCRDTGEVLFEAELWRLKGELALRRGHARSPASQAETPRAGECFEKARTVARAQGAVRLERRAGPADAGLAAGRRRAR